MVYFTDLKGYFDMEVIPILIVFFLTGILAGLIIFKDRK